MRTMMEVMKVDDEEADVGRVPTATAANVTIGVKSVDGKVLTALQAWTRCSYSRPDGPRAWADREVLRRAVVVNAPPVRMAGTFVAVTTEAEGASVDSGTSPCC
jgi:hypothetical protein